MTMFNIHKARRATLPVILGLLSLVTTQVFAWGNHTFAAYRSFEKMPEVASAPSVVAEPLDAFLKAEEKTIEALLASQEAWANSNLEKYPPLPAELAFKADPARTQEARRQAFLMALRVAANSKFALFYQPDPHNPQGGLPLPHAAVSTLPDTANATQRFLTLRPGDSISPLTVIATASDEPDYGLDINVWEDSPSEWGKLYGLGPLPFGNPALSYATQAPFHMGFYHESRILYVAAPFIKRTFPLLRAHQFSTLASLAFRTGHPYWGWRFSGIALHYVQDLTQPYHASLSPGDSVFKLLGANFLAMAGMERAKNDMIVLLSNRHLALEKYQNELLAHAAATRQDTSLEKALRNTGSDASYPAWNDTYLRDVVAKQAAAYGPRLVEVLVASLPYGYVSDPSYDFGVNEGSVNLMRELSNRSLEDRARLENSIAELLGNFGSHSRNAVRGILRASSSQ